MKNRTHFCRINNIRLGKINIENLLAKETVYKGEPRYLKDYSHRLVGPCVKVSSLPVIKSLARDVKTRKAAEEKAEKKIQRQAEQAAKRLEKPQRNCLLNSEIRSSVLIRCRKSTVSVSPPGAETAADG